MSKFIYISLFTLFLFGCAEDLKDQLTRTSSNGTDQKIENLVNEDSEKLIDNNVINSKNTDSLSKFLIEPIDLQDFKIRKGEANSGGFQFKENLFRPNYQGFYIRFYIFPKFGENGPRIVTYRKGEEFGYFHEKRDTLIQLFSDRPDKDLKNADLVLKNLDEIKNTFGNKYLMDGEYVFYIDNNIKTVLTICASNKKVKWFKVTRLNKVINSINDVPLSIRDMNAS